MQLRYFLQFIIFSPIVFLFFFLLRNYLYSKKTYFISNLNLLIEASRKVRTFAGLRKFLNFIFLILTSLIILVSLILIARPSQEIIVKGKRSGIDIIMTIDTSRSMLEEDIKPNRLLASREVISKFARNRENDRLGLMIFTGTSATLSPLTFDYKVIDYYLEKLSDTENSWRLTEGGSGVGNAIISATKKFDENSDRSKIIIVITDGESNTGISLNEATNFAKDKNIKVYGIFASSKGDSVALNNLQKATEITGGKAFEAKSAESLSEIMNEINKLEKKDIEVNQGIILVDDPNLYLMILGFIYMIYLILKGVTKI